jgi:hypothetical protein
MLTTMRMGPVVTASAIHRYWPFLRSLMGVPAGTDSLAPQNGTESAKVADARARIPAIASAPDRRMDDKEDTNGRIMVGGLLVDSGPVAGSLAAPELYRT